MTPGLVLEGQSEPEKGSMARTDSHCPDKEENILLEQLSHGPHMWPTICDPNISFWSRVNREFIKERFNDITSIPSAFFHAFS